MKNMQKGKILIPVLMAGLVAGVFPLTLDINQIKNITDTIIRENTYKRVIIDDINTEVIELFKDRGCLIKNKLKNSASFECPEDIVSGLNVRESRIFQIMDLTAVQQIDADDVWSEGITGNGVKVAILDTGIDTDHPELADSYLGGYDYVNNDPYPEDDNGHGSHVTGIITSNGINNQNSKGVSPGAGIYMYKVCNSSGQCYEDDIMAALEGVTATDAKVISISIGGGSFTGDNCDTDPLAAKINQVVNEGITVVAAAGNDGKGVSSPGCASKAIAVGAVDSSNNVPFWSGRGKALDIVAPGYNIYSTIINGYSYMSGTSMATPHVAGVIALLLEKDPSLNTGEIKTALYENANPVNKCYKCTLWVGSSCYRQAQILCNSQITGAGVVNAYNAYLSLETEPETQCSSNNDCDDGIGCTLDNCVSGLCLNIPQDSYCGADGWQDTGGTRWISTGQCTEKEQKEQKYRDYYCSLTSDCQYNITATQWVDTGISRNKANGTECDDGLFCNIGETCQAGVCAGGMALSCNDNQSCTADSCNENKDSCEYIWPDCGIDDGCCGPVCSFANDTDCQAPTSELCWSSQNRYLYRNGNQAKKFCKCAQGTYGYSSYTYSFGRVNVYRYGNTKDNENWSVSSSSSYLSINSVRCLDGLNYSTNQDYYYPK